MGDNENKEEEKKKGGEVVFCGNSNWSLIGRKTKTEKFDGNS